MVHRVVSLLLDESPLLLAAWAYREAGEEASPKQLEEERKRLLEHILLLIFLTHCFTNLAEVGVLRRSLRELYSLLVWRDHLQPTRLQHELSRNAHYSNAMRKLQHRLETRCSPEERLRLEMQHSFVPCFVDVFLTLLESIPAKDADRVSFVA